MRYGLIADIHGNLEALNAVLKALAEEDIDAYLCVGDIVGYGADPGECLRLVRALKPKMVIAGNHEWGTLGLLAPGYFNKYAERAIAWAKDTLNAEEKEYIASFGLTSSDKDITLVHGSLDKPSKFNYILGPDDAEESFRILKKRICFVGHSHVPGIFYYDGAAKGMEGVLKVKIESGKKYIVNVGSVGQPRDGDPRAAFAIYDDSEGTVAIRRVPYDIKTAQGKILAAGLPERLALRLAEGQ